MKLVLNYIHSSSNWPKIVKLHKIDKLPQSFQIFKIIPKLSNWLKIFLLILYGLVWFGYVMFWLGLVWFCIIWCVSIVQIWYHAKFGACSFKNVRVMPILVLFGMVWFCLVMFLVLFGIVPHHLVCAHCPNMLPC